MRTRVLAVLLLAAVLGVGGGLLTGWGVGYLRQPQPAAGGAATPLPASSPSVPVDPPTSLAPYADDIDYPPLAPGVRLKLLRMGNSGQSWRVPVPRGWQSFSVSANEEELVPVKERSGYDELRFRPRGEPDQGGYSLRVKTVNAHVSPSTMVADKLAGMKEAYEEVTVLGRTEESIRFTFRDSTDHLRYNYFWWFAAPGSGEATLEMSVAGREADEPGLADLFASFGSTLAPVE